MIDFNSKIEIEDVLAWMDGGSITLKCKNELGQEFEIEFVQNVIWEVSELQNIPGRIYLNGELILQRSQLESDIILSLSKSHVKSSDPFDKQMIDERLEYVKSEEYLTDQSKIVKLDGK